MSEINMELKNTSETHSSGENALLKCVFSKGCGSGMCYSVSAFSAFSQFLLHSDGLSVSCCPWCPVTDCPCPWCAMGRLWAAQAAALRDGPGSLDMLPQSSFTPILFSLFKFSLHNSLLISLLNFPSFIFGFLGTFLGWAGCVCCGRFLLALH